MIDRVAVVSSSGSFRDAVRSFLEAYGIEVVALAEFGERLPQVSVLFIDIDLLAPGHAASLAIRARAGGSDVILCGHWSRAGRLRDEARRARLRALEFPLHPRVLFEYFLANPLRVEARRQADELRIAAIAGLLYEFESLAVPDLAELAAAIAQRVMDVMAGSAATYHQLIVTDRDELAALAGVLSPRSGSMFQPERLFHVLKTKIFPALGPGARILCCASKEAAEALSAAVLLEALGIPEARVVVRGAMLPEPGAEVSRGLIEETPSEFRETLRATLCGAGERLEFSAPLLARIEVLPEETALSSIAGLFQVIIAAALDEQASPAALAESLLAPGGCLVLRPGEQLLAPARLTPQAEGRLMIYRRTKGDGRRP